MKQENQKFTQGGGGCTERLCSACKNCRSINNEEIRTETAHSFQLYAAEARQYFFYFNHGSERIAQ
jgi:hypothetical protein